MVGDTVAESGRDTPALRTPKTGDDDCLPGRALQERKIISGE